VDAKAKSRCRKQVSRAFLRAVEHAARNVRRVAEDIAEPWTMEVEPDVKIGQLVRPDRGHWLLHPGRTFRWFSTMCDRGAAKIAGVRHIQVACPRPNAAPSRRRWLSRNAGSPEWAVHKPIAALAYGTKRVSRVEKSWAGQSFVTVANTRQQRLRDRICPRATEAIDPGLNRHARLDRRDLLAQAEHAPA